MKDELDGGFDELDNMLSESEDLNIDDPSDSPDDVSLSVVGSATDALASNLDTEKIGDNLKRSILKSLPGEMGEDLDSIIGIGDTVIDKTSKQVNSARRGVANTLSGLSEVLPEFLGNSVKNLSNFIKPDSESNNSETEPSEDEKIANDINNIFGDIQTKEAIVSNINETTNTFLNKDNNELLASIVANTRTALDLKIGIDNKYYRKDLELQMKQTLTLVSMLGIMKRDSEIRTKQMEAIVKNTALPDFAKSRSSDFVKEMMVNNVRDVGLNAFKSTSVVSKASKAFTNLVNDKVTTFANNMGMIDSGVDALNMANENGGVANMAIGQGVDSLVGKASDGAVNLALKAILESQGGAKNVMELEKFMADPELVLEAYIKSEEEKQQKETIESIGKDKDQNFLQRTYSGAKSSLNNLKLDGIKALKDELAGTKTRSSYNLEDTSNLGEAQQLDGKLKKSIEFVIPNLLSKILTETITMRKKMGATEIDKADEVAFNFNTNSFVNKKETVNKLEKSIDDKAVSLVNSINNDKLIKTFTGKKKIDDTERKDFISGMMNYLLDGKTTSTLHMEEQDFLDYFKDDKLKGKITKKLKSLTLPGDPDKVKNRADVKKQLDNIQLNSISNYSDLTKKVSNTTDTTVLQDIGLTTDKDNNTVSSKSIKDLNKKYSENVISRISNGKITEDDKYKDSDGKILPGFVKGGSTGDGDSLEVAGVTHKNEYVINEDSLKDIIEDVKTGNEESMVDKVTTIVKEVGENAKTTKSYEYLNKKIDSSTKKVSELANEASTYFNNTFKDKTYIEKPKLDSTSPLSNKVVGKITNFKQSNKEYKDTNEVFNSVKKDVESLVNNLTTNITNTKTLVTDEFNKFTDTLPKSFDEATTLFTTKFNNIKDSLPKSFDEIDISIKSMSDTLTKGFTSITDMIPDSFKNTMDQYLLGTKEVAKSLKEDFKNMTGVDLDKKYDEAVDYAGNKAKELGIDEVYEDTKSRVDSAIDKSGKYLHNVIVENPEETNPEKIKYRDAGDIASDIANDTKKTLKNAFDIDVDKAYDEASTFVGNLFNGNDTNKKSKIDESTEAKSKDSKPKIYTGITSSSMDKTKELDLEDKDEKINTTVDNVIGDVNNTFTSENETSTLDTVKEISSNIANETSDLFNKTFTNKPINSKTKFSVDNKGKNSLQNIQQFKVNTDKTTLDRLSDMFSSLTKSFSKTGDNISESLDKNNSVFESLTSRFPDYKDMTNFFNDTGNFITSLISSNDKLDGVKLPEDKTNNNNESKEEVGAINETFKSATKAVSSGYDTFKKLFDNHDMSEEMSENIKSINKAISDGDLDSVLYEGLMETPLPKSYSQAVHLYKKVINGIDPSGKLWNKLNKDEDFIPSLEKIHIEAIAKGQKGLLEKTGEKIDDGLDAAGGLVGKARDKLLGLIPAPVRKYVEPLLKNRFTEFGAKTIGHAKEIFKGAGKATLSELGMVGKNVKDAFVGKDGKVRLPNIYELAKLTGKTAVGTSKALSIGIKTLYPELFGLAKDTVGLGVSTLWDFLGIKKAGKTAMAKMKAIIIPPIDRKLYRAWTKGEITSKEVFDKLKTEKEQEVWTRWLKDNTRPGITLPEIMGQTGKWYIKTMYGVAAGAKAVTENKTVRDSVIGATKLIAKGVWNFTAGSIPGLHIGDVVTKSKESELTFIDLIQEEFIEIFVEQVATINEQLKIDNASLLNKPISNLKKQQANKLTRLVKEINSLYVELESSHKTKLSNIIDKKISQMLTYVGSIKELKKKPAKKKDKIKDVIDKKSDTKIKTSEKDTTDKDKKDDTILDKFINIVSGINDSITDSENIKSENKDKSTKKKDDKKSVDASNDKSKKDDNTILGTFKKSMETITETFSKKIDEVKVEPKEKKPEYSPFDKDKDGDRDGNRLDRMKKLYGNTKDKAKDIGGKIINKVKDNKKTLLGTLLTFSPLLIGMLKNMLEPAFKMFTNIKDGILSIPYTIGNIIAHSLTGIGKVITKAISGIVKHIPGVKTITSIVNGAKNLGNKAIDGIKNTFKIAPKGKVAKFLQTLRVLKKKVVKKLGVKAGGKILSKISSKLIPGVGEALLAWDIAIR